MALKVGKWTYAVNYMRGKHALQKSGFRKFETAKRFAKAHNSNEILLSRSSRLR
jgi:hypothetical protein